MTFDNEALKKWCKIKDKPLCQVIEETRDLAWNSKSGWISYFAAYKSRKYFREHFPPLTETKRQIWVDALLDNGRSVDLLGWYQETKPKKMKLDTSACFQAKHILSDYRDALKSSQHDIYLKEAVESFHGVDILPGYVRRTTAFISNVDELHQYMRPLLSSNKTEYLRLFLALYDAIIIGRDPEFEQDFQKGTCQSCSIEDLEPWNLIKLNECKKNHISCHRCMFKHLDSKTNPLGECIGCKAKANRRELEMVQLPVKRIYELLQERYETHMVNYSNYRVLLCCELGYGKSNICKVCKTQQNEPDKPEILSELLKGLQGTDISGGVGLVRECYHCAFPFEKLRGCTTISCRICRKDFHFSLGKKPKGRHDFARKGVQAQCYVPKKEGHLWRAEIFRRKDNTSLKLGQKLSKEEQKEVLRRAEVLLKKEVCI